MLNLPQKFMLAAAALKKLKEESTQSATMPTGLSVTGNGLYQLRFKVNIGGVDKDYLVIEQNKDKVSIAAVQARNGHFVTVIKDIELSQTINKVNNQPNNGLIGVVDLDEKSFRPYNTISGVASEAVDLDALAEAAPELAEGLIKQEPVEVEVEPVVEKQPVKVVPVSTNFLSDLLRAQENKRAA